MHSIGCLSSGPFPRGKILNESPTRQLITLDSVLLAAFCRSPMILWVEYSFVRHPRSENR